jgi:hypothetical protein
MGVSETVIAASIGAAATIITAMVQLMTSLRSQNKFDTRPKRGRTLRSMIAVVFLMLASALSGYLFAQFRAENTAKDLRAMREELSNKLLAIEATTERLAVKAVTPDAAQAANVAANTLLSQNAAGNTANNGASNADVPTKLIESTVFVPACVEACVEGTAQVVPVCSVVPKTAQIEKVELYVADASGAVDSQSILNTQFESIQAGREHNGIKFDDTPMVVPNNDGSTLCIDFKQWSDKPRFARIALRTRESAVAPATPDNAQAAGPQSTLSNGGAPSLQNVAVMTH